MMHSLPTSPRPLLLCLLSGLPASGKSSLALSLCSIIRRRAAWACALICYDDIITLDTFQPETSPTTQLEQGGSQLKVEESVHPIADSEARVEGEQLAYVTGKESECIKGNEIESVNGDELVRTKPKDTKGGDSEQFKRVEPELSKAEGRLQPIWRNPARISREEIIELKGNTIYHLNRDGQVYFKGQEGGLLPNAGTAVQKDGRHQKRDRIVPRGRFSVQGVDATDPGKTADVGRHKHLPRTVAVHQEVLDCANSQLHSPTTDHWIANWKQYRQELILYVDCFLMSVANGAPLSAPKDHTEALWSRFICSLESQGLFSCKAAEAGSVCALKLNESSIPLCIVMDDNFYYQSMRYQVYQLARKYSAGFCQLFLDCTVELCLQRNHQRNISLPDEIIHAMSRKLERPNPDKNPWEQKSLILDMSECTWDSCRSRVTDLLQIALENPVKYLPEETEQKDVDRAIAASNFLHQADQAFRRTVSQTMQMAQGKVPPKEKKVLAKELHRLKAFPATRRKGFIEEKAPTAEYMPIELRSTYGCKLEQDHM
ncbi:hypothetical protein NDU88_006226 [Pleurodeles waltl]|uniref:L-seryl-tRNA(Sec) kinase n=1 Tax=Pleurodeles waltl TaxID=8319 RepID=A0AAV7QMZ2_PLEWA|nr:hypothetical protein NDU88_006226 [Pleurodeles waltl]